MRCRLFLCSSDVNEHSRLLFIFPSKLLVCPPTSRIARAKAFLGQLTFFSFLPQFSFWTCGEEGCPRHCASCTLCLHALYKIVVLFSLCHAHSFCLIFLLSAFRVCLFSCCEDLRYSKSSIYLLSPIFIFLTTAMTSPRDNAVLISSLFCFILLQGVKIGRA